MPSKDKFDEELLQKLMNELKETFKNEDEYVASVKKMSHEESLAERKKAHALLKSYKFENVIKAREDFYIEAFKDFDLDSFLYNILVKNENYGAALSELNDILRYSPRFKYFRLRYCEENGITADWISRMRELAEDIRRKKRETELSSIDPRRRIIDSIVILIRDMPCDNRDSLIAAVQNSDCPLFILEGLESICLHNIYRDVDDWDNRTAIWGIDILMALLSYEGDYDHFSIIMLAHQICSKYSDVRFSDEQLLSLFSCKLSITRMTILMWSYILSILGAPESKLTEILADGDFTDAQALQIFLGLIRGLSYEDVSGYAQPSVSWKKMRSERYGLLKAKGLCDENADKLTFNLGVNEIGINVCRDLMMDYDTKYSPFRWIDPFGNKSLGIEWSFIQFYIGNDDTCLPIFSYYDDYSEDGVLTLYLFTTPLTGNNHLLNEYPKIDRGERAGVAITKYDISKCGYDSFDGVLYNLS